MAVRLSVIIPVYNTASYLPLCIDSVLSQSFSDFELICVDNHSTDGSSEILREFVSRDTRVRLISTPEHGRATQTRQFGLEAATGEFFTYVDSDDSIKPGMYEHMFREQEEHDADIVVCNYDLVYSDRVDALYSNMRDEVIDIPAVGYPFYFNKYFCAPRPNNYLWSRIVRRSIAAEHGIEFQPVDISEDTIFSMFCTVFARRVVHISDSYYNYFQREDSTMRTTIRAGNIADSYVFAFECAERYITSHGLIGVFRDIMPVYAATRVRSMYFYEKLAGNSEAAAHSAIIASLRSSPIPAYLKKAISEELIDNELAELARKVIEALEKKI